MKKITLNFVLFIVIFFTSHNLIAQLNYAVSFPTTTYTTITGTKPTLTLAYPPTQATAEGVPSSDEGAANNIALPFTFNFNGINYNSCHISTNGFLALGSQIIDTFNVYWGNNLKSGPYNGNASNGLGSRPIIAPLWDDLDANSSTAWISYTTSGTFPNRVFTVQWNNAKWSWQATGPNISFQVKLYETTNAIDFVYKQGTTATLVSASASIGLSDIFTGSGNFLSLNGVTNSALASSDKETSNISTRPANNFTIRFTPIAIPAQDAGIKIYNVPVISTCVNAPQTISCIVKNAGLGNIAAGGATVNLSVSGANTGSYSISTTKAISFNQFDTIVFPSVNLSNSGTNLLTAVVTTASDARSNNDTSKHVYQTAYSQSSFPIHENVVASSVFKYTLPINGTNLWTKFNTSALTVPNNTLPLNKLKNSSDSFFFCFLSRYSGINSLGYNGLLYTNCLSLPLGLPAPTYNISFYMTQDSAINTSPNFPSEDSLFINVTTDSGRTWNRIAGFNRLNRNTVGFTWVKHIVALDAYAGKTIQIGFEGLSQMGNLIGLDEISILDKSLPMMRGIVYRDRNTNNSKDAGEYGVIGSRVNLSNGNYTFTDNNGLYEIEADSIKSYTLSVTAPSSFNVVPSNISYTFTSYDTSVSNNFALQSNITKDSLTLQLSSLNRPRPGFNYAYNITYDNLGTTTLTNAVLNLHFNSNILKYDSCSVTGTNNSGNVLNIPLGNLSAGATGWITVYYQLYTTAPIGSVLNALVNFTNPNTSSSDSFKVIVRGSYDPNDKTATPELSTQQVADGKDIDYIIRFQNTGNDTAIHVVITDTLDSKLKTSSLQMLATSHNCKTTVKDNVVFFEMRDIMLPDSNVNKVGSNGFIRFKIKPQNNLTAGTVIPNKAAIYFDYNAPVITNTAITTIKNIVTPVKVISYELRMMNEGQISNSWTTANETNIAYYNIMRSSNGSSFSSIGQVRANNKNSNEYSFIDNLQGLQKPQSGGRALYYRLMIVSKDGSISFSDIKSIQLNAAASIAIINNPVKNVLKLQCSNNAIGSTATIVNNAGVVVKQFVITSVITAVSLGDLAKGIYYVSANGDTKKFVVE